MNVDLWDTPVEIRLINPGAIDTEIWDLPGEDAPIYEGKKESPDDIAEGIVAAMSHPAGENEDFNVSAREELTVEQIARLVWEACGERPEDFLLERLPPFEVDVQRRWPSVEKARELLGFEARIAPREGIAQTVEWLRGQRATAATA